MTKHAMDSVRHKDENGHLIVDRTVITKADVNPYVGSSIPNSEALGLDQKKTYMLLRDPDELRKSLDTFKSLQLLIRHIPVDAHEPEKESTIGSIGSVLEMDDDGRVWSSLRVFDQDGIDYIESDDKESRLGELSAGYAYDADMTAGTWNGIAYDGIMRNIHGNHVAIVNRGRIGSDAIIADSIEGQLMAKKIVLKKGGIAKLQKQLGMDSAEEVKKAILAIHGSTKLALDEDDKKAEDEDDEDKKAEDEDDVEISEDEKDDKTEAEDEDDEDEKSKAKDEDDDKKDEKASAKDSKKAMDSAIQSAKQDVMNILKAGREVEPLVGVIALDGFSSDHDVYAFALRQKGVSTKGINTAGLAALVNAHKSPQMAMDSAPKASSASKETTDLLKRFK